MPLGGEAEEAAHAGGVAVDIAAMDPDYGFPLFRIYFYYVT